MGHNTEFVTPASKNVETVSSGVDRCHPPVAERLYQGIKEQYLWSCQVSLLSTHFSRFFCTQGLTSGSIIMYKLFTAVLIAIFARNAMADIIHEGGLCISFVGSLGVNPEQFAVPSFPTYLFARKHIANPLS
ncbi:hypothetical protein BDZ94DRAFT_1269307, partial [Collybia nuda]